MSGKIPFIGRQTQLNRISSLIRENGTRRALFIEGEGGIGKTSLLQEVQQNFEKIKDKNLLITEIIDFDDRSYLIPENVRRKITLMLGQEAFKLYIEELSKLRQMEKDGLENNEKIREQKSTVRRIFIENFNEITKEKRVVLFFDTTDALVSTKVWDRIKTLIGEAKNSVFILAGRSSIKLIETLKPLLDEDADFITLSPLTPEDSLEYLRKKQELLQLNIPSTMVDKLLYLANGRPIFIDLTVEWLSRNISLEWLNQVRPQELSEANIVERQGFEIQLVSHITQLRYPIDRLILILSRIYPLNLEGIKKFFDESKNTATELFDQAQDYVFIKTLPDNTISLHDEMRRMVNEYVWPKIDEDGSRRRRDSRIALTYVEEQMANCENQIREIETGGQQVTEQVLKVQELKSQLETLDEQRTEHNIFVHLLEEFSLYKKTTNKVRRAYDFTFAQRLQNSIQSLYHLFKEDEKYEFDLLKGRLHYRLYENDEAQKLFNRLLIENKGNDYRTAEIYNGLAVSEMNLGNLKKALEYQQKSLELFESAEKAPGEMTNKARHAIPFVANQVGLIYSKLGEWEQAIRFYEKAFAATEKLSLSDEIFDVMAGILNYWGYAYGMLGRHEEAVENCEEAIKIWQRLNLDRKVARGEALLGAVYRVNENFELAENFLVSAINRFDLPNDSQRLIAAYSDLGFTYHIMGPKPEQLKKAQAYLETGVRLAEMYDERLELPLLLSRLARLYWLFFQIHAEGYDKASIDYYKNLARKTNDRAYQMAEKISDFYTIAKCILGRAEFDIEDPEVSKDKISGYAAELKDLIQKSEHKFPLFSGRMHRIQAEVAFENKDYDKAVAFYAEGLAQINEHGGYGVYSIEGELKELAKKLASLPSNEQAEKWINSLSEAWSQKYKTGSKRHHRLVSWCRHQNVEFKFRSQPKEQINE
jgi:tetratricopeptide (TPR) repeat protein